MPSLDNYIAFRCQNADCAALVKMKPPQPGKDFIIVCPKCKTRQKWQYEGIDSQCKPVVVPKGIVRSEPKAEPKVEPDRPTPIGFMRLSPIPGRLVRVRSGFFHRNELINLVPGENTVGQRDAAKPSPVQIDDKFMSRRSVKIDVYAEPRGYRFKFTLIKSLNPAYFNGKDIREGFSKELVFGDSFRIGTTDFIFEGIDGSRKPIR